METKASVRKQITQIFLGKYTNRKKNKPLPTNAFCTLNDLDSTLREAYHAHTREKTAVKEKPDPWVTFRTNKLGEMLNDASKEKKEEVKAYIARCDKELKKPTEEDTFLFADELSLSEEERAKLIRFRKRQW